MTRTIEDFTKNDSFLSFDPTKGNEIEGTYRGYKIEEDELNQGEEKVIYSIQGTDGKLRKLTSRSKRLAKQFISVKIGESIRITRFGEGFQTQYQVRPLDPVPAQDVSPIPAPDDLPFD